MANAAAHREDRQVSKHKEPVIRATTVPIKNEKDRAIHQPPEAL